MPDDPKVEVILRGLEFPEGPAFDPQGRLWCVEMHGGNLVRWTGQGAQRVSSGGAPNGLAFDGAGHAWVCDAGRHAVRSYDPVTDQWQTRAHELGGASLNAPNDLTFDHAGNLLFTCPGGSQDVPTGAVCCLTATGSVVRIGGGLFFPNGLALVEDGRKLVVAETFRRRLWIGDWHPEAVLWRDPKPWADTEGVGGPDGMALGADRLLYVAVYRSGQIQAVDGRGRVVKVYRLPGIRPTNVAFDPNGGLGLVVTEAEHGLLLSLPNLGPGADLYRPFRQRGQSRGSHEAGEATGRA